MHGSIGRLYATFRRPMKPYSAFALVPAAMLPVLHLVARDDFLAYIGATRARRRGKIQERQLADSGGSGALAFRNTVRRQFARHVPAAES